MNDDDINRAIGELNAAEHQLRFNADDDDSAVQHALSGVQNALYHLHRALAKE